MASPGLSNSELLKSLGINHVPRPRVPPMFYRPPSPVVMERPQPIVPDVSLIIDSASTSIHSAYESLHDNTNLSSVPQSQLIDPSPKNNQVSPSTSTNFVNYFPTPSLNQSPTTSHSHLYSRDDLGRGGVAASASMSNNRIHEESAVNTLSTNNFHNSSNAASDASANLTMPNEEIQLLKSDVASILKLVHKQHETINTLNSQLAQILSIQEKILKSLLKSQSLSSPKEQRSDESSKNDKDSPKVHWDCDWGGKSTPPKQPSPNPLQSLRDKYDTKFPPTTKTAAPAPVSATPSVSPGVNVTQPKEVKNRRIEELKQPGVPSSSLGERNIEDFSTLLKHLEFSDGPVQSILSETSGNKDISQFKDDSFHQSTDWHSQTGSPIGPSASAYGDGSFSGDEEGDPGTPLPTAAYYDNLLTTVNKFLECKNGPKNTNQDFRTNLERHESPPTGRVFNDENNDPAHRLFSHVSTGTASYTSSNNNGRNVENIFDYGHGHRSPAPQHILPNGNVRDHPNSNSATRDHNTNTNVVEVTKRYLQSIGAPVESPTHSERGGNTVPTSCSDRALATNHQQNYMIQQNVYNSIYIPTVNCARVLPESVNSNSGVMENLANKYIPPADLNRYEFMMNKNGAGLTDTTVYGMSTNNLSFATKQYLQRYGLVGGSLPVENVPKAGGNMIPHPHPCHPEPENRILDVTAIRNQPKLL